MLRGTLELHGVDIERLARAAIRDSGLRLSWDCHEELLAELVAAAWQLSEKHDEQRYPGGFAEGCYQRLRLRIVDHVRRTEGRTCWQFSAEAARRDGRRNTRAVDENGNAVVVEHQRPQILSLDAPFGADRDAELGEIVAFRALDTPEHRDSDLGGALRRRDSEGGRPSEEERRTRLDALATELLEVSELSEESARDFK